uniref:Uncharacterized protein n=1 Tax=Panagrolaimus sp. PS1159 TaxID=55785 RepID=A0AC35GT88_9BILA
MSSTAATTMEALNSDLKKTLRDFMEQTKDGENQHFDAVLSKISSTLTFCQALTNENAQLLKSNNSLKSTHDRLVHGIAEINVCDQDLQAENIQLKQENGELKASNNDLVKKVVELVQTCEMKEAEKQSLEQKVFELEGVFEFIQTCEAEKKALEQKVVELEGLVSSYEAAAAVGQQDEKN